MPPHTQLYRVTARTFDRSVHYFAFPCFSWWCTISPGTGRGFIKPTSGFLCGLGLFTRSPSCEPQIFSIWKTQLELAAGTYADTTATVSLTLSMTVGPKTSSPSSSTFPFSSYRTEALTTLMLSATRLHSKLWPFLVSTWGDFRP